MTVPEIERYLPFEVTVDEDKLLDGDIENIDTTSFFEDIDLAFFGLCTQAIEFPVFLTKDSTDFHRNGAYILYSA